MLLFFSYVDKIIIPQRSPWFEFYKIGQDVIVEQFNDTDQFKDDFLGLKEMYYSKKIDFASVECEHCDMPTNFCKPMWYYKARELLNNTLNN